MRHLRVSSAQWGRLLPALIATLATAAYTTHSLARHSQMRTAGFDLGIFAQAVSRYAKGQAPISELKGVGFNTLGDHFHPIVATLAPAWRLFPDPRALLIAQAVLVGISVFPIWWFCRRRFSTGPSALLTAAYAFSWPLQGLIDFDFHEIAFAVPIAAFTIDLFDRGRLWAAFTCSLLLLLVREDMFMLLAAFALLSLMRKQAVVALAWLATAAVGYLVAIVAVIPRLSPHGAYTYQSYNQFGSSLPSALAGMARDPVAALLAVALPADKLWTVLILLLPLAFAPLLSPYVVLTLPLLASRFLSDREAMWGTQFHYSALLAPILVMAGVDGAERLLRHLQKERVGAHMFAAWAICWVAIGTALAGSLYPLHGTLTLSAFEKSSRVDNIQAALQVIPHGVCLEADNRIAAQAVATRVVSLTRESGGDATWMILDMSAADVGRAGDDPASELARATSEGWQQVWSQEQVVVLTKPGPIAPRCAHSSVAG